MAFSSIGKYRHQSDYGHPYPSPTKRLTISLLKGGMGDFWKKISCRLISRRKHSCKEIPGEKTLKKKYLSWLIILKKNLTLLFVGEEDSITRGLEKKNIFFCPNQITHTRPPSKVKWSAPKQASSWDLPYLVLIFYFLVPCLDCCSKRVRL